MAARITKTSNQGLNELVVRGLFPDKSSAIRRAIENLLNQTGVCERRLAEPIVNRVNEVDDISKLIEEVFSLKSK